MLMYGPASAANIKFGGKGVMYNLSSMKEGFISLQALIPPNTIGRLTDREFDIAYANYIMSNDTLFCIFFQIIYNLYIGKDVFIIVSTEDWSENLLESLLKLIQQRYGYNAVLINTEADYLYAATSMNFSFAPGYGIFNLDQDKERFTTIIEQYRIVNNGALPLDLEGFVVISDE
jgi:hypothetical protein